MSEDRFQRFRRLERPRQAGAGEAPRRGTGAEGRFGALEEPREQGPATGVPGGHLDRFRPAAERPVELAPAGDGELPFVRCASCQTDHHRAAALCANCGADLRTEAQRAFDARLGAERRAQAATEEVQLAELERARREAGEAASRAKRQAAEALAREVGDAERRRLDAEGLGGFGPAPRGGWDDDWGRGGGRRRWGAGLGVVGWLLALLFRFLFAGRRRG